MPNTYEGIVDALNAARCDEDFKSFEAHIDDILANLESPEVITNNLANAPKVLNNEYIIFFTANYNPFNTANNPFAATIKPLVEKIAIYDLLCKEQKNHKHIPIPLQKIYIFMKELLEKQANEYYATYDSEWRDLTRVLALAGSKALAAKIATDLFPNIITKKTIQGLYYDILTTIENAASEQILFDYVLNLLQTTKLPTVFLTSGDSTQSTPPINRKRDFYNELIEATYNFPLLEFQTRLATIINEANFMNQHGPARGYLKQYFMPRVDKRIFGPCRSVLSVQADNILTNFNDSKVSNSHLDFNPQMKALGSAIQILKSCNVLEDDALLALNQLHSEMKEKHTYTWAQTLGCGGKQ